MSANGEFDYTIFKKPLKHDSKGRYYLPMALYRGAINESTILVATFYDEIIRSYRVHTNSDGSRWIKGDCIAKYWMKVSFDSMNDVPSRLFLDEEIIKKLNSSCI